MLRFTTNTKYRLFYFSWVFQGHFQVFSKRLTQHFLTNGIIGGQGLWMKSKFQCPLLADWSSSNFAGSFPFCYNTNWPSNVCRQHSKGNAFISLSNHLSVGQENNPINYWRLTGERFFLVISKKQTILKRKEKFINTFLCLEKKACEALVFQHFWWT